MTLLAIKTFLGAIPGWIYAALVVMVLVGAGAWHLIGQRNEAREDLATARTEIARLEGDNRTLRGNQAELEAKIVTQNESIRAAAQASAQAQARVELALKAATQRAKDADARNEAWKEIQKQGDRSKGGDYAHDARRARLRP